MDTTQIDERFAHIRCTCGAYFQTLLTDSDTGLPVDWDEGETSTEYHIHLTACAGGEGV